jgi:hypothetical protein
MMMGFRAPASRDRVLDRFVALRQDFARQREIDRSLGLGLGERERAVDHRLELGKAPELVIPLDELADHRGLVEGFLCPVDVAVTAPSGAGLRDRVPPGGEQDGHVRARGMDDAPDGIARADDHVDHHGLRPS